MLAAIQYIAILAKPISHTIESEISLELHMRFH
jgi:hypothetical protein